jgi:hypothetical protein
MKQFQPIQDRAIISVGCYEWIGALLNPTSLSLVDFKHFFDPEFIAVVSDVSFMLLSH